MPNRTIPYGYKVVDGHTQINETEQNTVSLIFERYITGISLKAIAELLTKTKTEYAPNHYDWNKNRVKRIIENKNYIGNITYPQIINEDVWTLANSIKEKKYSTCRRKQNEIKPIARTAFCLECGHKLCYLPDKRFAKSQIWHCNTCGVNIRLTEDELMDGITEILIRITKTPKIIDSQYNSDYKTADIMRLENQIGSALERKELEKSELTKLILECASKKYDEFSKSGRHITEKLKASLKNSSPLEAFNYDLYKEITQKLQISKEKICLLLKNGYVAERNEK